MKPPICSVCERDQRDVPELEFDLVRFRDFEPIDCPGHPEGLLWFCSDHLEDARNLAHLPASDALRHMRTAS